MTALEQLTEWANANDGLLQIVAMASGALVFGVSAFRRFRKRNASTPPIPAPARRSDSAEPLRLVVLPFGAIEAPDQQEARAAFWADVVHRELTARLARVEGSYVVAIGSTLAYKNQKRDYHDIAREFDVRYIVEGTVQVRGESARVDVELISAQSGDCEWTNQYERPLTEVEGALDEVATAAANHLGAKLRQVEARRVAGIPEADLGAWDFYLQAGATLSAKGFNCESFQAVEGLLRKAVDRDPEFAQAKARLALNIALSVTQGFVPDSEERREEARQLAISALDSDSLSSEVLGYAGCALSDLGFPQDGLPLLERAIELNPSNAQAHAAIGAALVLDRRPAEGIPELEHSIALSPKEPALGFWLYALGSGYLLSGDLGKASEQFRRSVKYDPNFALSHLRLGWLANIGGDEGEARRHFDRAKELMPAVTPEAAARILGHPESDAGQFLV